MQQRDNGSYRAPLQDNARTGQWPLAQIRFLAWLWQGVWVIRQFGFSEDKFKNINRRYFLFGGLALVAAGLGFSWPVYRSFGALPEKAPKSPNWQDGAFRNLPNTYVYRNLANEPAYPESWLRFFFSHGDERYPPAPVNAKKDNLKTLRDGEFVWLGHSSILCRLGGKIICIDPVLSSHASPLPLIIPAWDGTQPYSANDFPFIDYLCITHDHWDHLDYPTIRDLKFGNVLTGKGVGAHFKRWGIKPEPAELDWFEEYRDGPLRFTYTPSMHFSGRGTKRNQSLWGGFALDAGSGGKLYFTGDGGFGDHFRDIGNRFGPFEMIFPDSGQYNRAWSRVHMFPEQSVQAAVDTKSRLACPVHHGKFTLAWHPWNEPALRFSKRAAEVNLPFILPEIGEKRSIDGKMT